MESSDENKGQIKRAKKLVPGQMVKVRLPELGPGKRDGGLYQAVFIEYVGQDQWRIMPVDKYPDTWTSEGVKGGLNRFYRELAGVGLVFPRADWPVAVEYPGYPVVRLRRIEGIEFVLEAVAALGSSTELATHLFRECWAVGTGSEADDLRHGREVRFRRAAFGCE